MAKFVIFGLRGLQAVLALGNLGLSAYRKSSTSWRLRRSNCPSL
jgi:hypothetical protein